MALFRVLLQPVHGDEGRITIRTSVRAFAGVLTQVPDERILVPELERTSWTFELFLSFVNLKKENEKSYILKMSCKC